MNCGYIGNGWDREVLKNGQLFYKYLDPIRKGFDKTFNNYTFGYSVSEGQCEAFYETYYPEKKTWKNRILRKIFGVSKYEKLLSRMDNIFAIDSIWNLDFLKKIKKNKVIEVSHGFGYPNSYYERYKTQFREGIVDYVLCYDQLTKKTLRNLYKDAEIFITSNHYFDFYLRNKSLFNSFEYRNFLRYKKKILFTSSWGYAGEDEGFNNILKNGVFPEYFENIISKNKHILFVIRLHPVQNTSKKQIYVAQRRFINNLSTKYSNVCSLNISNCNLFSILEFIDLHVTMISMTAYECASFGIPTCFLCPTLGPTGSNKHYFQDLVDMGLCIKCSNNEENVYNFIKSREKTQDISLPSPEIKLRDLVDLLK